MGYNENFNFEQEKEYRDRLFNKNVGDEALFSNENVPLENIMSSDLSNLDTNERREMKKTKKYMFKDVENYQ